MADTIRVRLAEEKDVPRLAEVEKAAWGNEGTPVYGEAHFRTWLEIYPDGFFLAEVNGVIEAFSYSQIIDFNFEEPRITGSFDDITDHGFSRRTHRPDGNSHFGITICSLSPGAGREIIRENLVFTRKTGRPMLGVSRLPDFCRYMSAVKGEISPKARSTLALHYGIECAKMVQGRIHPQLLAEYSQGEYPPVSAPDSVLRKYLKNKEFMLLTLLPDFWQDPKSLDFSFLFGYNPRE